MKFLGQNFLHDKNILRKITGVLSPVKGDTVLEIGPGQGALTEFLLETGADVTAVEIDRRAAALLREKFPQLRVVEQDFLATGPADLYGDDVFDIRVAGNLPYNVTSPIVFRLLEQRRMLRDAVFMVQYEVARRMTSDPGTKDYGILAVLMNAVANVSFCFKVPPTVFYPQPKVWSAVIHIDFTKESSMIKDEEVLRKLVKTAFNKRRKTLKNTLSGSPFGSLDYSGCDIDWSLRPERITIDQFIAMANAAAEQLPPAEN